MRELSYREAILEAQRQALELDPNVFVFGQGVDVPDGVLGTTGGLTQEFGEFRCYDTPCSESAMTGVAIGAALRGMRPVLVHQRADFLPYAMDAMANWAAVWRYKSDGRSQVPFVVRAIVGKGWGQGPQHYKSYHSWISHVPGVRVALPATPHDAKGLLLDAIFGNDPTVIFESRQLFDTVGPVPEEPYRVPFGKVAVRREGADITLAAWGGMVPLALEAAEDLDRHDSVSAQVVDMRTVSPMPAGLPGTERKVPLVVCDPAWRGGSAASVGAQFGINGVALVNWPYTHAPATPPLEKAFYPTAQDIREAALGLLR